MSLPPTASRIPLKEGLILSLPFGILVLLFFAWTSDHPFFWDSILLGSKTAQYYFDHNFAQLLLPLELDAGHPPFFGAYLALWWTFLGRSLLISHLAMLPILLGTVWQLARLVHFVFPEKKWQSVALLLLLTDATLLGQWSMVSPDIVLVFAGLFAINSLLRQQYVYLILATILLSLLSIRGLFALPAIYGLSIFLAILQGQAFRWSLLWRTALWFVPVTLLVFAYYTYHYLETGWWISTPNEGWSSHRQFASFTGMLRNVGLLIWRMIDFGRVGQYLLLLFLLFPFWQKIKTGDRKTLILTAFPIAILLFQLPSLVLIQNPIGHRYLMLVYLLVTLLVVYLLSQSSFSEKGKRWSLLFLLLMQLSGHFWVYPDKVAQGWDASLAHVPYFALRKQAIDYLDQKQIPIESVGTEFPNNVAIDHIDLNGRPNTFAYKDFKTQSYMLYSNVFNDFSDQEIDELYQKWSIEQEWRQGQIRVVLFKKLEQ